MPYVATAWSVPQSLGTRRANLDVLTLQTAFRAAVNLEPRTFKLLKPRASHSGQVYMRLQADRSVWQYSAD